MNKLIILGFVWCAGAATCGWCQEINVTATGVEVGAGGSSAAFPEKTVKVSGEVFFI